MELDRWQQMRTLFQAVLELGPEARAERLAEGSGEDAELRAEVESLLAAHEAAAGFLSRSWEEPPEPASLAGERIGPYQVVRKLGAGGMGVVYFALRADGEFQRRVALKVLKPGLDSEEVIRRFRAERQILAALEHPNIARLLDGGTTAQGRPYFVMEYVEGQPLDAYCADQRLSLQQRLELFLTVCSAVELAHRNLVVHRDIKPGNILVMADGTPKLLDFGIAKLLNPELSALALGATAVGLQPLTPDYASPEQVRGGHITTASDVYSLGVLLYELLAGIHPYRMSAGSPADLERRVTEEEPLKPSLAAASRDGERCSRQLAGDLDNIILKALRKEPNRRYASVEQLAADVRRHLAGQPVLARPGSLGYRATKFLRRHRMGVAAAAALVFAILGFGIGMGVLAARLATERDHAEQERRRAEQVTAFLTGIFEVSDPLKAPGDTITAREILDLGSAKIAAQLQDQPGTRAALAMTIGGIYRRLALYDRAIPLLESALATRRRLLGEEHEDVAVSMDELADARLGKGETAVAAALFRRSLDLRRKLYGGEHLAVATSLNHLANVHWAKNEYAAAKPLYLRVLEMRRRQLGEENEEVATSLNNLANVLHVLGDLEQAERLHRDALRIRRELLGDDHPDVSESRNNLATVLWRRGQLAEARSLFEAALHARRVRYGDEHPAVANVVANLALVLHDMGDDAAAEPLYRQVLASNRKTFGARPLEVARALNNLASLRKDRGDLREAETLYQEAIGILRASGGPRHPHLGTTLAALADVEVMRGNFAAAEARAREALPILAEAYPAGHWRIAAAESVLAGGLIGLRRQEEAETLLLHSQPILAAAPERTAALRHRETLKRLVELNETLKRPQQAARYREQLASLGSPANTLLR